MRRIALLITLAVGTLAAQPSDTLLILTNGRILDSAQGRYRSFAALVVDKGLIASLQTRAATPPPSGRTIDLKNAIVAPGLCDAQLQGGPGRSADVDYYYALSLANGVLTARVVNADTQWAVRQRERIRTGAVLAPRVWTSGVTIDARGASASDAAPRLSLMSRFALVGDSGALAAEIRSQATRKVDWVQLGEHMPLDLVRSAVATARTAGVKVGAMPGAASLLQIAQSGAHMVSGFGSPTRSATEPPPAPTASAAAAASAPRRSETAPVAQRPSPDPAPAAVGNAADAEDAAWAQATRAELTSLVAAMRRASRLAFAPRLAGHAARLFVDQAAAHPSLEFAPTAEKEKRVAEAATPPDAPTLARRQRAWEARIELVRDLAGAGVAILTASGADESGYPTPGFAVHEELRRLVEAGLTPAQAIRAATSSCAAALGAAPTAEIKQGAGADFIVVDGDPLQTIADLSRITMIVRAGETLDRSTLLEQAKRARGMVR